VAFGMCRFAPAVTCGTAGPTDMPTQSEVDNASPTKP
jgi:hypothetical protein